MSKIMPVFYALFGALIVAVFVQRVEILNLKLVLWQMAATDEANEDSPDLGQIFGRES